MNRTTMRGVIVTLLILVNHPSASGFLHTRLLPGFRTSRHPYDLCRRQALHAIARSNPRNGVRALSAQLDPSSAGDSFASLVPSASETWRSGEQILISLDNSALESIQEYIFGHPIQDAVFIALAVFTTNALKAGASLPVAIVAAGLELLRQVPGWTMIGSKPLLKLGISLVIDFIGIASYALPLVGEVGDFAWAPASAILVKSLYGSNVLASMGFVEELVPGTDLLPTATIGWALEYVPGLSQLGWVSGMASTIKK